MHGRIVAADLCDTVWPDLSRVPSPGGLVGCSPLDIFVLLYFAINGQVERWEGANEHSKTTTHARINAAQSLAQTCLMKTNQLDVVPNTIIVDGLRAMYVFPAATREAKSLHVVSLYR